MYDDLLGKRKKKQEEPKKKPADLDGVIFPATRKLKQSGILKALNYKVDEKTPNGHVYLRKEMDEALTKAIKRGLWLVSKMDKNQDPAMVLPQNIVGKCIAHHIDPNDNIMVEIKYLKGFATAYRAFDITTAAFGFIDKKGIVKDLTIAQLFMC
jgi:hypothetical protein